MAIWIPIEEAASITSVSISTIRKWCSAGAIDPKCGRRFGRIWRFKREVLEEQGFIINPDRVRRFRIKGKS